MLNNFYLNNGYYNAKINTSFAKLTDTNSFEIIFNIDANEKYFFNNLSLNLPVDFDANNFNHSKLTLGNIFKVNENVKIKKFKDKILKDNLTVVVINNKGKILGYITIKELRITIS